MKNTNSSFTSNLNHQPHSAPQVTPEPQLGKCEPKPLAPPAPPDIRTTARDYANPVDYKHPYPSMAKFADLLALRYDANRTRHSYYRQLRLIHQHFNCDPSTITEAQLREYFLFVKLKKHWKPKSIRQALASARVFFVELLGKPDWSIFSQIRAKDHDTLPAVLTRQQVQALLAHIRLRRYRTPLKLIYCCGLRLSECLGLTVHDIRGKENKLLIRNGKGAKDRVVPLPTPMYEELRRYWAFHRHPLLLFPNVGRGDHDLKSLAQRMRQATCLMPCSSLQRLVIVARKQLNIPAASVHSLTLPGIEFVRRYLRHVLPLGLRSVRYYGFCHPTAKACRLRVQLHSGRCLDLGLAVPASDPQADLIPDQPPLCPKCGQVMKLLFSISLWHMKRGPPPAKLARALTSSFA